MATAHQSHKASPFTQRCEKMNGSKPPLSCQRAGHRVERPSEPAVCEKPPCRVLLKSPSGLCHIRSSFVSEVYETLRVALRMYGRRTGRHIVCAELGVTRTYCILRPVPIIKRVPPYLYYTDVFRTVSVPCVKLKMSSEIPREEKRLSVCLQSSARFWFSFSVSARFID